MGYHGDSPLTTSALFTTVRTGTRARTLESVRLTLPVCTQHFSGPAGCWMYDTNMGGEGTEW